MNCHPARKPAATRRPLLPALGACLVAAACSAADLGGGVADYGAANAMVTSGHFERQIEAARYEVGANGTPSTPPERVRKIALARAAEIGTEEKLGFFKIAGETQSVSCRAKIDQHRGAAVPANRHSVVKLDVVYAKAPPPGDTAFLPSADTFNRLTEELRNEAVPPEAAAAARAAHQAACG